MVAREGSASAGARRWPAFLAAAVLTAVLCLPSTLAAPVDDLRARVSGISGVLDIEGELWEEAATAQVLEDGNGLPAGPGGEVRCTGGRFRLQPAGALFREGAQETGCGSFVSPLYLPLGTAALDLEFVLHRYVEAGKAPVPGIEEGFEQRLQLLPADGDTHLPTGAPPLYDQPLAEPTQFFEEPRPVAIHIPLSTSGDHLLRWTFTDLGARMADSGWAAGGAAYAGDVADVTIHLKAIPLDVRASDAVDRRVVGTNERLHTRVAIEAPRDTHDVGLRADTLRRHVSVVASGPAEWNGTTLVAAAPLVAAGARSWQGEWAATETVFRTSISVGLTAPLVPSLLGAIVATGLLGAPVGLGVYGARTCSSVASPHGARRLVVFVVVWALAIGAFIAWRGLAAVTAWTPGPVGYAWWTLGAVVAVALIALIIRLNAHGRSQATAARDSTAARAAELEAFLQSATHDLKTPLITLEWLTADLEADLRRAASDPSVAEGLHRMRRAVGGMGTLVNELLEYGRLERRDLMLEPLDLGEVVAESIDWVRASADRRAMKITAHGDGTPAVMGDAGRLSSVFRNLLTNAVNYGRTGGRIDVRIAHDAEGTVVHVDDDGDGVPVDERAAIFEPFRRGSRASSYAHGSGIGLALVRRTVVAHGGAITVGDAPTGGARFTIRLPPPQT